MTGGKSNIFYRGLSFFTAVTFFAGIFSPAYCHTLYGKKAKEYLGHVKNKLLSRDYSVITLDRRSPDSDTLSLWDGIIFFPGGINYGYIRRLNFDYVLRLGPREKETAVKITKDNVDYYLEVIKERGVSPAVILDKEGEEVMVVYRAFYPCHLRWYRRGETLLLRVRRDLYDRSGLFSRPAGPTPADGG